MADVGQAGGAVERARAAASRGAWADAYQELVAARDADELTVADLPDLATAAYAAGHLDDTIATWERVHGELLAAGDATAAAGAAVRVAMHLLFDTALMAPVRGWLRRAEGLLEPGEETPARAWLDVVRAYERLLSGDPEGARRCVRQAVGVGSRADPAAAAIARVAEARLLLMAGEVEPGLALLEEAATTAVSGDLDPLSTGVVYCEVVCALQGSAHYDLAEQWTDAMERWGHRNAIGSVHGRCRVHRAEILRLRGACPDAEEEVQRACDELRPYVRRELGWPLTELGRIRLHRGDLAGAETALLAAHRAGWDPEPALSQVRAAQGDLDAGATAIQQALDRPPLVPSKESPPNSQLRRAPLLDALVDISTARHDTASARTAADELATIAERHGSRALRAAATRADAAVLVAAGDAASAVDRFRDAIRAWTEIGAPYEAAQARLGLAGALAALGNADAERLERRAAEAALHDIATAPDAVTPQPETGREADVFRRDGDSWTVEFDGRRVQVRDAKGMRHLARLLAAPGRELHVLDLVSAERGDAASPAGDVFGDAGELLDARAKEQYRRRLAEIDDDIDDARADNDEGRIAQAQFEREFLVQELARAIGLGGRDRRAAAASERARSAVTQSVRKAITRVAALHPPLGDHLRRTVRTGTYCSYLPDSRVPPSWQF
ncbi:transcriptional regulator [Geodermatophilus sp. SYSU D01036]